MFSPYKLSVSGLSIIHKLRHHKGYGIHSQFVFDLVNKVIEEKASYYQYKEIQSYIENLIGKKYTQNKTNLLYFKLVNYFNVKNILYINPDKINLLYLTAPSQNTECTYIWQSFKDIQSEFSLLGWNRKIHKINCISSIYDKKQDCIVINLEKNSNFIQEFPEILSTICTVKTFIVVEGIRSSLKNNKYWKELCSMPNRTAVLDLFNIGIIFFDKGLYRWKYQISF